MEDFDASIREKLFYDVSKDEVSPPCKITVVGVGMVGMACTVCTLLNDLATDLVLVGVREDKLKGEVLDLRHGSLFLGGANITGGSDYSLTAGSKVVVITAGVRQKVGESRLSLVQRNVDIFKHIIPQIARHSPDAVLLLISNPVDLMTYVAWKLSGFPRHRVIGSGTNLDSARFRHVIASRLQVCPSSVHGLIVGEHGNSSVPLWSSVTVAGRNLSHIEPRIGRKDGPKGWDRIHHEVVRGAYEVIQLKGYTNWAIGFSCAQIVRAITRNSRTVLPLSCFVKCSTFTKADGTGDCCLPNDTRLVMRGLFQITGLLQDVMGTDEDVCLSLPCTIDSSGVSQIVRPALDSDELFAFRRSVELLAQVQNDVKW